MTAAAALSGVLFAVGLWTAAASWRPVPVHEHSRWSRSFDPRRLAAAGGGALALLLVTRWPVAAVAGSAIGWVLASANARRGRHELDDRTEAIALWAEMLRDAIGTARGVEGVLVATATTAPLPIRAEVQAMARRLQHEPLDAVLGDLATDLDHPIGDLVVTALRLTSTAGGRQVRDVLTSLAAAAYAEAESRRRVEVARQRPRSAMRYTAIVIAGFVALLLIFSRQYLEPYDSAGGQAVLVFVALYWAAGFWWMQRMGRVNPVERFLAPAAPAEVQP